MRRKLQFMQHFTFNLIFSLIFLKEDTHDLSVNSCVCLCVLPSQLYSGIGVQGSHGLGHLHVAKVLKPQQNPQTQPHVHPVSPHQKDY